ncbi:hypothetical protein JCM6882_009751 [Rhodosporidiobolus microsporus]
MASLDEPPPPSFFGKLPVELLKHIVAVVREQDKAFWNMRVEIVGPPVFDPEDKYFTEDEDAEPSKGRWGAWYGYGLSALSLCNKQLRALCMPYLFETTTSRKVNDPAFTVGIIDESVCRHVRHLELDGTTTDDALFAVASALMRLPRLERLTLSAALPFFIKDPSPVADIFVPNHHAPYEEQERLNAALKRRKLAREAFGRLAGRITSLNVRNMKTQQVLDVLDNFASPASLRVLKVECTDSFFARACSPFQDVIAPFSLHDLDISCHAWSLSVDPSWTSLRLPTVTSFTLQIADAAIAALELVNSATPALRRLHLRQTYGQLHPLPTPSDVSLTLPHLTHLTITGRANASALVPLFSASPLRSVALILSADSFDVLAVRNLAPLQHIPASVRHLHLAFQSRNRPSDFEAYRSAFTARGASSTIVLTPSNGLQREQAQPVGAPASTDSSPEGHADDVRQKAAIAETLDYARRRLEWMWAIGDREGIDELAQALDWVRERQYIESS